MFFNIYIRLLTFISNIIGLGLQGLMYRKKPDSIKCENNLKYSNEKWAKYDLYYPENNSKKPVFIYIHGGGFVSGKKDVCKYYCYEYAKRGYFVINIDYQYAPQAHHPEQLRQIFKCLETVFDKSEEYNLDLDKIAVGGESAGAYFSVFVAGISRKREYYKYFDIDFKYRDIFKVDACVLICGIYRLKDVLYYKFSFISSYFRALTGKSFRQMRLIKDESFFDWYSPLNIVDEDFAPSVIIHATRDTLKVESEFLAERLDLRSVPYIRLYSGGLACRHAFPVNTILTESKRILDRTVEFLDCYVINKEGN